jgi:hypothetical protein
MPVASTRGDRPEVCVGFLRSSSGARPGTAIEHGTGDLRRRG